MKRYGLIGLLGLLIAVTAWAAIINVPEAPARITAVVVGGGGGGGGGSIEEILRPVTPDLAWLSNWTASTGDKYSCIDEAVTDDADYVSYTGGQWQCQSFNMADTSTCSGKTIDSVVFHARFKTSTAGETIAPQYRGGEFGTNRNFCETNPTLTTDYAEYTCTSTTNLEDSGNPWTSAWVDYINVILTNGNTAAYTYYASQVWLVVNCH